jgi:hypothetical protein
VNSRRRLFERPWLALLAAACGSAALAGDAPAPVAEPTTPAEVAESARMRDPFASPFAEVKSEPEPAIVEPPVDVPVEPELPPPPRPPPTDADWVAAARRVRFQGYARLGDEVLAVVNGRRVQNRDTVSVVHDGRVFRWRVRVEAPSTFELVRIENRVEDAGAAGRPARDSVDDVAAPDR